jgi:hypothetical protein
VGAEDTTMNPYESPELNVDRARYDRTLFWRICKFSMWMLAFFVILDIGVWALRPSMLGVQGADELLSFLAGENSWLREQLEHFRNFMS